MDSSELLSPTEMYRRAKAAGKTRWKGPIKVYKLPCDCLGCAKQYLPVDEQQSKIKSVYAGSMSGTETAALSRRFCTSLFEDLQVVRSTLYGHGESIHRRWLKKSNTKRKTYLKHLRPDMYENQNTFMDIQMDKCVDPISTRQYRNTFLTALHDYRSLFQGRIKATSSTTTTCRPYTRGMGVLR